MKRLSFFLLLLTFALTSACNAWPFRSQANLTINDRCLVRRTTLVALEYRFLGGPVGWKLVKEADDIPYNETLGKNPQDFQDILHAPEVAREDNQSKVTFYTWTPDGGILARWEVTAEGETLKFYRAEVVDHQVGDYRPIPFEGRWIPLKGKLLANDATDQPLPGTCAFLGW
jgi:hypothetical protein